jgi:DNA invertase Pin-like site-specific DNA recombinase
MSPSTLAGPSTGPKPAARPIARQRAALYARVSTADQSPGNQLEALRAHAGAREWIAAEFVDHGVSGAKASRPGLDALLVVARARRVDVVACTKLDRLARSTRHLVTLAAEFEALGVELVVLDQAIDTMTPSGRLLFIVLAAIAEFERDLIRERVVAGIHRARRQGRRLGRPRLHHVDPARAQALLDGGLSVRAVARQLRVHQEAVRHTPQSPRAHRRHSGPLGRAYRIWRASSKGIRASM